MKSLLRAACLSFGMLCTAHAAHAAPLSGSQLVTQLRQGGYVLLMRHASSPAAPPDKASADPANVRLERQLDEKGRATAAQMGRALKALHIPVGAVLSSPTFRALQTVKLAGMGTPTTFPELGDGGQSMQASAVAGEAGWLKGKVAEAPAPGSNTIIVTHMPNIVAAFGDAATGMTDGETLVFKPDGHGGAELVGKLPIEDWPRLVGPR